MSSRSERHACRCCGNLTLDEPPPGTYAICPVCWWEDDATDGGANRVTLDEARANYRRCGAADPDFASRVRARTPDEYPRVSHAERTLKSARTFLSRWQGVRGHMRELTLSHQALVIVLSADDRSGNLVIWCGDPQRIHGPVRWTNCGLTVDTTTDTEDGEPGFAVRDPGADLEVICGALAVSENVKRYLLRVVSDDVE